jgi:hypothetical protein
VRPVLAPAIVLAILCAASQAQQVTPVQVPQGVRVHDAAYADVDGDGLHDLVIATTEPERGLRIHLQQRQGVLFKGEPDYRISPLYKDAVAFAVGDVHADPGSEIVLFSARGIFAWRPKGPEEARAVKIADCNFLWQLPFRAVVAWQPGLNDLDRDGLVDIVVPEPDGYRAFRQSKPGVFEPGRHVIVPAGPEVPNPEELSSRSRRSRMVSKYGTRISVGGGGEVIAEFKGPLVDISDRVPAPQILDFDADGKSDIIARTTKRMYVWQLDKTGQFGNRPSVDLLMPVIADRERRLEVSYSAHAVDLDLDRRADCVIFSGDQRSKDVRTQVQFFTQRGGKPLFGERGLPDQLLVLAGFAGIPRFDDVNGDGYPDLFAAAVRPDLLDTLRGGSGRHLDAEVYVFLNRKGKFPRRPDLLHRTKIQVEGMKPTRGATIMRFFGDVTGDGVRDLLVRDAASRLKILMTRRTREGLKVIDEPAAFDLKIHERASIKIGPSRGRRRAPDLLILERSQVVHVRFK